MDCVSARTLSAVSITEIPSAVLCVAFSRFFNWDFILADNAAPTGLSLDELILYPEDNLVIDCDSFLSATVRFRAACNAVIFIFILMNKPPVGCIF
jgi:hypothetical protein